jgi:delta8-fatty-acid desaturase
LKFVLLASLCLVVQSLLTISTMANSRIYTRRQIENLIATGQTIIIFRNDVLRLNNGWAERHPGGKLVLAHMVGRDATAEIDAWVYTIN